MANENIALNVKIGNKYFDVAYATSLDEARNFTRRGFEPVECSFGFDSVVGRYELDHHGRFSYKSPVSEVAAQLALSGTAVKSFVFAGTPDPDSIFAALSLRGAINPTLELGAAIGKLDIDPFGIDRTEGPYLKTIDFERRLGNPRNSLDGFIRALQVGCKSFSRGDLSEDDALNAKRYEAEMIREAPRQIEETSGDMAFVVSDGYLRDAHYTVKPVVVQYKPGQKKVTVRALTRESARVLGQKNTYQVFGPNGAKVLCPMMDESFQGGGLSGGREDIVGSPRDVDISYAQAKSFYDRVSSHNFLAQRVLGSRH